VLINNIFRTKFNFKGLFVLLLIIFSFNTTSSIAGSSGDGEKFNAGEMILHHIGDAYEWHVFGNVSIPLPVIIYSSERGLDVFSSAHFHHGQDAYNGYRVLTHEFAEAHHVEHGKFRMNKVVALKDDGSIDEALTLSMYDISITKNVANLILSILFMLWLFLSVAKAYKRNHGKAPSGIQSLIEPIILFVKDDIAVSSIGEKKYKKYMPFLLTVFFFIWINNLLGLVPFPPGGANLTGNIAVTMILALFTLVIVTVNANKAYWEHIFAMPGVPKGILLLLTPIEILGFFLRPFVLMVRLFANITAGHIIALSFFSLIFIFGEMSTGLGYGVSVVTLAFTVFMTMLELLVAFLQAYVFTFLSAIYFGAAVEEHHHDH